MITANSEIFAALDRFCATRGVSLLNAGKPRWISSEKLHHDFLINATMGESISFSPGRKLARFDLSTTSFVCAIGFDQESVASTAVELDLNPALLTVALYELKPRPTGSTSTIRQVVEVTDKEADPKYSGHAFEAIASLFPSVRFFQVPFRTPEQTWSDFFRTCIDECEYGLTWMEGALVDTLRSMCDLDAERIPYRVLCRSVFDGDPASFFLALYRCLEALYAFSSAQDLITALGLQQGWAEVATVLEDKLGWHPREEGSLTNVLSFATDSDLKLILNATSEVSAIDGDTNLTSRAAKRIYWLRNSIVHYRPAQHRLRTEKIDWVSTCQAMANIVVDVYRAVFTGKPK